MNRSFQSGAERVSRAPLVLEAICDYAVEHGLAALSLRPLARAVGSSTGVLHFLFGSKDQLVARVLELLIEREQMLLHAAGTGREDGARLQSLWRRVSSVKSRAQWLACLESDLYSIRRADHSRCAEHHTRAWLAAVARAAPSACEEAESVNATLLAAVLRGALLDIASTGDTARVHAAVRHYIGTALDGTEGLPRELANHSDENAESVGDAAAIAGGQEVD